MKKFSMTRSEAEAHQLKHGFSVADVAAKAIAEHTDHKIRQAKRMNKTELEYSHKLDRELTLRTIIRWEYEGMTLRWGGLRYTPDFTVFTEQYQPTSKNPDAEHILATMKPWVKLKFIEVKGKHIWGDSTVKFKAAKAHYPMFEFEMWQKKDGQWNRIQ